MYLSYRSCHPYHVKKAVPLNLFHRICQIVDTNDRKNFRIEEMKKYLLKRHYPKSLLDSSAHLAISKQNLLGTHSEKPPSLNFISTFNPNNPHIKYFISLIWKMLQNESSTARIFGGIKLQFTYKKSKTIKNILCPSKLSSNPPLKGIIKCNGPKCEICDLVTPCDSITIEGKIFKINSPLNCNSTSVIYVMFCICGKSYLGETSNFRQRVNLHKSQLSLERNRKIYALKHIFSCGSKFSINPIYMCSENTLERETIETHFINMYKTLLN